MINIICVGKIKEKSLTNLCDEYLKRISKYSKISVTEISDEKFDKIISEKEVEKVKEIECSKIMDKISSISNPYVICLDLKGSNYTSEMLANKISNTNTYSSSNIVFVIGGSLGLTDKLIKLCNDSISFSSLTFPHQLIKLFLLEQIFRSYKILNKETYHH